MSILMPLRADAEDVVRRAVSLHVHKLHDPARALNPNVAFMSAATLIDLVRATSEPQPTLREWITTLERRLRLCEKPSGKQ